jgi:hypothetical protein
LEIRIQAQISLTTGRTTLTNTSVLVSGIIQNLILAIAAIYAGVQVLESRKMREAQFHPYVTASIQLSAIRPGLLVFRISNLGATVARNIKITVDPPFTSTLENINPLVIKSWSVLADGIPTLVPKQDLDLLVDSAWARLKYEDFLTKHDVKVEYFDEALKKSYMYAYSVDFAMWLGAIEN